MNDQSKLSREERWEARKRAKFSQERSFENPSEILNTSAQKIESFSQVPLNNYPEPAYERMEVQMMPERVLDPSPNFIANAGNELTAKPSLEGKRFIQQQENFRGKTPPNNSFFLNPVSEAENKRLKMQEEYRAFALQDAGRKNDQVSNNSISNNNARAMYSSDQQQSEDFKKKMYNNELQRQIEENKKKARNQEKVEEYFPFGKPGAGAPFRDSSGRIIATRPPRFNENDPNFNKIQNRPAQVPLRSSQEYFEGGPAQYIQNVPQYAPNQYPPPFVPQYVPNSQYSNVPVNFQPSPQYSAVMNQAYENPPQYNQYPPQNFQPPKPNFSPPPNEAVFISDSGRDYEKSAEYLKKIELQRALQEQIEEKQRKKEEEKRRKLLEEKFEEDRLMRERMQMEEEFRKEAEKKRKQINELQSFNNNSSVVVEPVKKGRRPRTPIDFPPPEPPRVTEESKRRGQSASKSPVIQNNSYIQNYPAPNPNEIPQEYINYLNSALDRKISEIKGDFKMQEMKHQEEILQLKTKNQVNNEQNLEAQREIERLREELKKKQIEEDIRHKELAMALANTKNIVPINTRLPPYEPRPYVLQKTHADASLSLDYAARSLVSESKFIPLPNPPEMFPVKPPSPKEKKTALNLDSVFPSIPDTNYETFRSAGSSIGIDSIIKKNDERLKNLEKYNADPRDELNKLDEILFQFNDNEKKKDEDFKYYESPPRKLVTPGLFAKGENLPSIKELDGEGTFSLPEVENKALYNFY